jgi:hypothetical protein
MSRLHRTELDCLHRIARGDNDGGGPCTDAVLRHLADLGLVERVPTQCLPLEMPRTALRLTPAGRAALEPD